MDRLAVEVADNRDLFLFDWVFPRCDAVALATFICEVSGVLEFHVKEHFAHAGTSSGFPLLFPLRRIVEEVYALHCCLHLFFLHLQKWRR